MQFSEDREAQEEYDDIYYNLDCSDEDEESDPINQESQHGSSEDERDT